MDYFQWLDILEKNLTPKLKPTHTVISGGQVSTEKVCCHLTSSESNCRRSLKNYGDMAIPHPDLD